MISATFTTTVKVRAEPSITGATLTITKALDTAVILQDKPTLANGYAWWPVQLTSGLQGWSAQRTSSQQLILLGIEKFREAINFTLTWEGGYINNPKDPGGETKYGISKRHYPHLDIKNLTLQQAKDLYYQDYWLPVEGYLYSYPRYVYAFDIGVLCGIGRAAVLRNVSIYEMMARQNEYFTQLETFEEFGRGWIRRNAGLIRLLR